MSVRNVAKIPLAASFTHQDRRIEQWKFCYENHKKSSPVLAFFFPDDPLVKSLMLYLVCVVVQVDFRSKYAIIQKMLVRDVSYCGTFVGDSRDMHERIKRRQQQSAAFMDQSLEEQAEQIMRRHGARLPRQSRVGDGVVGLEDDGLDDVGYGGGAGSGAGGAGDYLDDDGQMDDPQAGIVDPEVSKLKTGGDKCRLSHDFAFFFLPFYLVFPRGNALLQDCQFV